MKKISAHIVWLSWIVVMLCCPSPLTAQDFATCDRVKSLVPRAIELRNLPAKNPVSCSALTGTEYKKFATKLTQAANDRKTMELEEILYKGIGLIPLSYPYASCMLHGGGNASWAMYDRESKRIVVRSDMQTPEWILIHEIIHALQDQHYDLKKIRKGISTSDQDLAITAFTEGDAIVVEQQVRQQIEKTKAPSPNANDSGYDERCQPPEALFNIFMFVYEWGGRFVSTLTRAEVDRAFRISPRTTRDILYPKEFVARSETEAAERPKIDLPELSGYRLLYADVLGEYVIRALLKTYAAHPKAILAAKGWENDRVGLYKQGPSDAYKILWLLRFDKESDTTQFLEAIREYALKRFGLRIDDGVRRWHATVSSGSLFAAVAKEREVRLEFSFRSP